MSDRLAALYPDAIRELRIGLSLPAPRFPNPPAGTRNLGTAREFYGRTMLREVAVADGDLVAFIDKAFPHSRYDVMMLASDDAIRSSIDEVAPRTRELLFDVAARFVDYLSDPDTQRQFGLDDGHLHVSYNYDRYTVDRENSMFYDKRFHLHLNYWPGRDIGRPATVPWRDLDVALRRRLVDPVADLSSLLLWDATGGTVAGWPLLPPDARRDVAGGLPFGPKLRLPGWSVLRQPDVPAILQALHLAAEAVYEQVHRWLTGVEHRSHAWWRPRLLPYPEIEANVRAVNWLSRGSAEGVLTLARSLNDLAPADLELFRSDEGARVRRMTLGGLDYAVSMFSQRRNTPTDPLVRHDHVYLVMQPKLFADIGGAGLPSIDDVAMVRVDRSSGLVMTDAEIADRTRMREQFLDRNWRELTEDYGLRRLAVPADLDQDRVHQEVPDVLDAAR